MNSADCWVKYYWQKEIPIFFLTSFLVRYAELSEEMERLRKGYSDRNQEIKGLEEKIAAKEKQEAILQLELKNAHNR